MRLAKTLLFVIATVALASRGFDCLAMTDPEQAMQCCQSMPCAPSGHHGQDCCKTMATIQTPFVQTPSSHVLTLIRIGTVAVSQLDGSPIVLCAVEGVLTYSNAPLTGHSPTSIAIRI
jgi:hypothetical protein